jgi:hypothetical protein
MRSKSERLSELLERAQRQRAQAELSWLRRGTLDTEWVSTARSLLDESHEHEFTAAQRERVWTLAELRAFVTQRAMLAFHVELAKGTKYIAELVREPYALPFGSEAPAALVAGLSSDGSVEGRTHRATALARAAEALAPRLLELRMHALKAYEAQIAKLPETLPEPDSLMTLALPPGLAEAFGIAAKPAPAPPAPPPSAAATSAPGIILADAPPPVPPSAADRAREFLASTDDATREMTRWLVKPTGSGTIAWHVLLRAVRAAELDGLAKPARRLARLANGLRGLDFERDLNARVRGESAAAALEPRARVLALSVPSDIRIAQSTLQFGVLSDVYAAHGVGQGLALALISPAQPDLVRRPVLPGVADAIGTTFMQLRADPEYLRRIEGLEPLWVEKLGRHAGIIVLLEARVRAALSLAASEPRDLNEWSQQLTAALERALAVEVPPGLATLAAWSVPPGQAAFEACAAGLAAQVGLRDRYDADWYRNPRVSEVLRGAATRGTTLALPEFLEELGVEERVAAARVIELLG